jgi:uncharacterized membrane protein YbhN (UPF0104 family)
LVGGWVRLGLALLTSFYEVLTSMATGVLLAAFLFAVQAQLTPATSSATLGESLETLRHLLRDLTLSQESQLPSFDYKLSMLLSLLLFLPVGIPVLPPIFNRLAHRLTLPFRDADATSLPRVRGRNLVEGLILSSGSWFLMGASLWSTFRAVGVEQPWTWATWEQNTASIALAYVAGFLILLVPSGLGVREFLLTLLLVPQLVGLLNGDEREARDAVILAVLLLRLVWTAAELVIVGVLYWVPFWGTRGIWSAVGAKSGPPAGPALTDPDRGKQATDYSP